MGAAAVRVEPCRARRGAVSFAGLPSASIARLEAAMSLPRIGGDDGGQGVHQRQPFPQGDVETVGEGPGPFDRRRPAPRPRRPAPRDQRAGSGSGSTGRPDAGMQAAAEMEVVRGGRGRAATRLRLGEDAGVPHRRLGPGERRRRRALIARPPSSVSASALAQDDRIVRPAAAARPCTSRRGGRGRRGRGGSRYCEVRLREPPAQMILATQVAVVSIAADQHAAERPPHAVIVEDALREQLVPSGRRRDRAALAAGDLRRRSRPSYSSPARMPRSRTRPRSAG